MIEDGRIDYSGAVTLLVFAIASKIYITLPALVTGEVKTAGWITLTAGGLVAILFFTGLGLLLDRFPGHSLVMTADQCLTPWLSRPLIIFLATYFLLISAVIARQFAENFIIAILPRTPISFVLLLIYILVFYTLINGLEGLSRIAMLFSLPFAVIIVLSILMTVPYYDFSNLYPLWGEGLPRVASVAFWSSGSYSEILLLAVIAPHMSHQRRVIPAGVLALALSAVLYGTVTVVTQLVFPYEIFEGLLFPVLELSRTVSFGELLQRLDPVFVFTWSIAASVKVAAGIYGAAYLTADGLNLRDYRPILLPLLVLSFTIGFVPQSFFDAVRLNFGFLQKFGWIPAFLVPAGLLGVAVLRGKKGV